jgi:hypothetical protein
MNARLLFAGAISLTVALGAAPISATPVSAFMYLEAHAEIGTLPPDTDTSSVTWAVLLAPLSTSATANVSSAAAGLSATVGGAGSATFGAGGNSGAVSFTDYGWNVNALGPAAAVSLNSHVGGDDWTYTFVADFDGLFTMDYDVVGTGDTFGLWGWSILWSGPGGSQFVSNANDPTTAGSFVRSVQAGVAYTVSLSNNANLSGEAGLIADGHMDGSFIWAITPSAVPEPGTFALVAFAALLGAFAARRRAHAR